MKRIARRQDRQIRLEAALAGINLPEATNSLERLELSKEQKDMADKAMAAAIERKKQEMKRG
jgi:hypothetical protein